MSVYSLGIPQVVSAIMIEARTAKVLGALLVSMTLGALLLMIMEQAPPALSRNVMASLPPTALQDSRVPISSRWRRIIVHSAPDETSGLAGRCHFVVRPTADDKNQWTVATPLWANQKSGNHIYIPGYDYNAESIGICVIGDFSKKQPNGAQFEALMALVTELQKRLHISADRVYLRRHLSDNNIPGLEFPDGAFQARLHKAVD